ncbi:MAG: oxygen-dependent coproporphyrinogen oxidase [Deltaproteobacteria bacterium]|nr:oxygen-dependent coproporphyrinogen oxidase [Deltaproteobacteria bacterium]
MLRSVPVRDKAVALFKKLQAEICGALEQSDGKAKFTSDRWDRSDLSGAHGGGGDSRVLTAGAVFEQAGVNFSEVYGYLPDDMSEKLTGRREKLPFFATGVSLVIHPYSPMVPTTHANFRYLEVDNLSWFGGGMDLTPYYLFEEDARHFHRVAKEACDRHDSQYYPAFKKWCDEYFYLPHRGETRGIGGIFFDYLGKELNEKQDVKKESILNFVADSGQSFTKAYIPIVERRKGLRYSEQQKEFQLLRRGRYVEFNLLYDRGTLFGLKTGGRTESILMSMPPLVRWSYNYAPPSGSEESRLLQVLMKPCEWI